MSADLVMRVLPRIMNSSPQPSSFIATCDIESEEETPKTPQRAIPKALLCPPTPKKKPQRQSFGKRKICELEFFDVVSRDEVESFFATVEESINMMINGVSNKRRCAM